MFSNVGWGEILVLFILGLILIGPERLPKVIEDIRALLLAARTAINDARDNLSDEFGEDFDDLRKPLQELNDLRRLNPKTAITRTLFDGDDTYLDMLSGKPAAGGGGTGATCLLYTSDAADEGLGVDLGGRRIIKKKKKKFFFFFFFIFFFFFKQKTAYEMLRSLVGSEMCIRDSQKAYSP